MKKHKKKLSNYTGSFEQLANELGDLTYDSLAIFLKELSIKLSKDGDADFSRGRQKLSKNLKEAANNLFISSDFIDKAWNICEPYTNTYE